MDSGLRCAGWRGGAPFAGRAAAPSSAFFGCALGAFCAAGVACRFCDFQPDGFDVVVLAVLNVVLAAVVFFYAGSVGGAASFTSLGASQGPRLASKVGVFARVVRDCCRVHACSIN